MWGYSHHHKWGLRRTCGLQFAGDFCGLEEEDEESREVFSNLLMEDNLTELAAQHEELSNEDLMELEGQSKEEESQEGRKINWKTEEVPGIGGGKGISYLRRHC